MPERAGEPPLNDPASVRAWIASARAALHRYEQHQTGMAPLRDDDSLHEAFAELDLAEQEMRRRNHELLSLSERLEQERSRYRMLFEAAPDGYVITDPQGVAKEANRAAGNLLGVPREQLAGRSLIDFVTPDHRGELRAQLSRLARLESVTDWETELASRGGSSIPVSISAIAVDAGTETRIQWLLRDGRDRRAVREAERRLEEERAARHASERLADYARLLAEASRSFNEVQTTAETVDRVITRAVPVLADLCILDMPVRADGPRRYLAGRVGLDEAALDRLRNAHFSPDAPEGPMRAMRTAEADVLMPLDPSSLATMVPAEEDREAFRQLSITALISMPLTTGAGQRGALSFAFIGDRSPEPPAIVQAAAYADRAGVALAAAANFDELVRQREAAAAANQAKDRLLATVSHDFRTPLAAIVGYADLMLSGIVPDIPERALQWVQRIRTGADHQVALVDQILAFTRLESGGTAVELRTTDLRNPVREACELVQMGIERAGLEFTVRLPDAPVITNTDAVRVRQVLTNLLSNALRNTSHGSVSVDLVVEERGAVLSVTDTGSGIPEEAIPHIFEQYWQANPSADGSLSNWGLGLAIVRNVVDLLGGTIDVASQPGSGTRFDVVLPLG